MKTKSFKERNSLLFEEMKNLDSNIERLSNGITGQQEKIKTKTDLMNEKRKTLFDEIDSYFEQIFTRLRERREQLKDDYKTLE